MNDKNQNEPKPDYSFILNQAGPEATPQKSDKKFFLIVGLLVLLSVVIFASLAVSAKRKVATTKTPATTDVAANFLQNVQTTQDDKAYALLSGDFQKKMANGSFSKTLAGPFRKNIDLSTCTKNATSSTVAVAVYGCKLKSPLTGTATISLSLGTNTIGNVTWKIQT